MVLLLRETKPDSYRPLSSDLYTHANAHTKIQGDRQIDKQTASKTETDRQRILGRGKESFVAVVS